MIANPASWKAILSPPSLKAMLPLQNVVDHAAAIPTLALQGSKETSDKSDGTKKKPIQRASLNLNRLAQSLSSDIESLQVEDIVEAGFNPTLRALIRERNIAFQGM
jgi:hypothetical protein